MKSLRFLLSVALMSLALGAFAQSDPQKSDAQKSFDKLKALAGSPSSMARPCTLRCA